jgi:hypothetical protein
MEMKRLVIILLVLSVCFPSFILAETITIKSGKKIEGKIVERTDKYIKVDCGVGIPLTYFFDMIESIDGVKQASSPTEEEKQSQENNLSSASTDNADRLDYSDTIGITIKPPLGWLTQNASDMLNYTLNFFSPGKASMSIARSRTPSSRADGPASSLEVNVLKMGVLSTVKDNKFEFKNEGTSLFKGISAYTADMESENQKGKFFYFYKNGYAFNISYSILKGSTYDSMYETISKSLDSLEFK